MTLDNDNDTPDEPLGDAGTIDETPTEEAPEAPAASSTTPPPTRSAEAADDRRRGDRRRGAP